MQGGCSYCIVCVWSPNRWEMKLKRMRTMRAEVAGKTHTSHAARFIAMLRGREPNSMMTRDPAIHLQQVECDPPPLLLPPSLGREIPGHDQCAVFLIKTSVRRPLPSRELNYQLLSRACSFRSSCENTRPELSVNASQEDTTEAQGTSEG